jgi:hypothetical protein
MEDEGEPEAGVSQEMTRDLVHWAGLNAPELPFATIMPEALRALREHGDTTGPMMGPSCFDADPHIMARAYIDTATEFCRAALAKSVTTAEPEEWPAANLEACQAVIDLSSVRRFHQLTGDEGCGGTGYAEPRFLRGRAYIFHLQSVPSDPRDADVVRGASRSARYFKITGVRYDSETPSMYFGMEDLFTGIGFDRMVGEVPESVNPARHYLIFDVEPFWPEVASAE